MKLNLSIFPISEGYGRVLDLKYAHPDDEGNPNRTRPTVLQLGKWRHPKTKNMLVGGFNLKYLNDEQKLVLRRYLPDILVSKNLKSRYWAGRRDVPNRLIDLHKNESATILSNLFKNWYRTYNQNSESYKEISTKTFRHMSPSELKALGGREDADEAQELKKLADEIKAMQTAGKKRGLGAKIDKYNKIQASIEQKGLKTKVADITAMRDKIDTIKAAGGDTRDLENQVGIALGELPLKPRKKLEKKLDAVLGPPEPAVSRMEPEPVPEEPKTKTVQDRAQDAVDSNVAQNEIAKLDPDIKKQLHPTTEPKQDEQEGTVSSDGGQDDKDDGGIDYDDKDE